VSESQQSHSDYVSRHSRYVTVVDDSRVLFRCAAIVISQNKFLCIFLTRTHFA
jgi:hypothetical protein